VSATLLRAATVVTLDAEDRVYRPGYLLIDDGRIVEVAGQDRLAGRRFDREVELGNRLVMPGLVNAHTHSPMALFRGLAEGHSLLTFEGWYNAIRVLEEALDPDLVPAAVEVSCAEMIRTGTTCFADQYFCMDRIVPIVRRSGLRAALAYGIVEMGNAAARQREIAAAMAFLESVQGDSRLTGWIGPHAFFVDNSLDAIRLELQLADRFKTGLHIHLATSGEEERYCREHYGCSAVEQMKRVGILDRRVLAAHCITVPESDFPTLAAHPFAAVICASACMRSGAEAAPLKAMREAGILVALGTDNVANNNSYDLFNEMQTAAKLMSLREHQPNAIPARDILRSATRGGAQALGLEQEIGSLAAGKRADLIALDLDDIGWGPSGGQHVYTALVYATCGMHVTDVMVDGVWLLRNRQWTTIDYAAARAGLDAAHAELRRRLNR
jgi:5-methylthioadenosine/S-adenosylhomocysteine deaminase